MSESGLEKRVWQKVGKMADRLQGHAPLVLNAGLFFSGLRWEVAQFLNYTSAQIWAMGFDPAVFPHLLEERRWLWEAQVSYRFSPRWEVRVALADLLNQPYRRTQRALNADRFVPDRDAIGILEQPAYRAYFTLRYWL